MKDFDWLREVASRHTGIVLSEDKYNMLYSRLSRRIRSLNLDSFAAYCKYLCANEASEIAELVNAITTNLTAFFREPHHFEHLRNEFIPMLLNRNRSCRRIRIWSAGCSTGEEPYSLAITLADAIPQLAGWDVKILATDIDSNVLKIANQAEYEEQHLRTLTYAQQSRWFRRVECSDQRTLQVNDELRALISFKQLNLLHEWPMHDTFDAVFCRNVIIYFGPQTKKAIVEQFANYMHQDSRLFLGHSESLFRISDLFSPLGQTIYTKAD
jgi:chemotaxis protein methyltransferase CheR